ncbi:MAG: methionyl-tRNA formyltransferase [Kordiimonadaceae bacterium]|nr:methionyl-tRNA formyltransferase [Kordiimonadaceae bacterium]
MRLAFMGTPDFAVPTLHALVEAGHEIVAVYSQPPRPAGRGKKDRKSAVQIAAEKLGLTVYTPASMKEEDAQATFEALALDVAVVVAYGQILKQRVLSAPQYGCVNVHASLLPRWRGAAPIHRAIMAGDSETGVCIMQMELGLDTGPVIARTALGIEDKDTVATLHDALAVQGASLINAALQSLKSDAFNVEAQPEEGVTYAKKIAKSEAKIDWSRSAVEIDRQVRGLFPFPGAWTEISGERVKILAGSPVQTKGETGLLLDDALTVGCGDGAYQISRAQRAGKAAADRDDFLRGFAVPKGANAT